MQDRPLRERARARARCPFELIRASKFEGSGAFEGTSGNGRGLGRVHEEVDPAYPVLVHPVSELALGMW